MSEKPVEKQTKATDASPLLAVTLEPAHEAATKFRHEANDQARETTAPKTEAVSWRNELQNATTEIKKLEQLKAGDPASAKERKDLIESIDKHFQKALPLVRQDATSADSELLVNVAKATVSEKDFKSFKVNGQTINPDTAKMDDIHNAILNAPDDATRKQLTRLGVLAETRDVAMTQVDESYFKTKAPMMAALDYANFLIKYKDGITQNNEGHILTASAVLNDSMSQELAASPQGKVLIRLAGDCNPLLPSEKNPLIAMQEAMSEQDPKKSLDKLQHAANLAQDKYFDHDNLQNEIKLEAAKNDNSPVGRAKLAGLESFAEARAQTEAALGLAQMATGKNGDAVGHLLNAAKDPSAAEYVAENFGKTTFDKLLVGAMTGNDHNLGTAAQGYIKTSNETLDHYAKYSKLDEAKDYDGAAKELKLANASADEALKNARAVKGAIGDENAKKIKEDYDALNQKLANKETLKPEEEAMRRTLAPLVETLDYETNALYRKAKIDIAAHNHNSAVSELEALQKLDPVYVSNKDVKPDFDNQMKLAKDGAEYDNSNWAQKRWLDTENLTGHAWEFAKQHEKLAAAGVALVGAAAITFGTAGFGAPIGAAIVAGVGLGTAAGTAVGATAEMESGHASNVWSAMGDVAPSAFAGAATGALLAGAAPVGEGALAAEGGTGAEAGTSLFARAMAKIGINSNYARMAMPGTQGLYDLAGGGRLGAFAANSLRAAEIAAPFSLTNSYENYKSGEDKTFGAAAFDFAKTDLEFGLAGGLTKTPWVAGKIAKPLLGAFGSGANTTFQGYMLTGSYFASAPLSTRFDKNSVTLPAATEQSQTQDQPGQ